MHSRFSYLAIVSAATLAFSGCEWGGAHENTWNDGYSWANFTGTYRFVNALITPSAADDDGTQTDTDLVEHNGSGGGKMETSSKASGKVSPVGEGIIPGSFALTLTVGVIDDSQQDGTLYRGSQAVGSVSYSTGAWSINSYVGAAANSAISISYRYWDKGSPKVPKGADPSKISYLNVTQLGNKLTMTGDSGIVYSGRITGSNVGRNDYQSARSIYISFEASSANGQRITGNFSGEWSGASDKSYGVLSNRKVNGTHSRAGNFVGVAADKTIYVADLSINETTPSTYYPPGQ